MRVGAVVSGICIISGDVALYEYENGIVKDLEHNLRALRYSFVHGEAERLYSILAENAVYYAHCYWMLRKEGKSVQEATKLLEGQTVSFKNELLFSRGINFDKLPSWQKRGIGLFWDTFEKEGYNPMTDEKVVTTRRGIKVEYEIPLGQDYSDFVARFLL